MRISDQMIASSLIARIGKASALLFKLQQQVASGLAFERPSENPPAAVQVASLGGNISELERYQANCDQASAWLRLTEVALGDVSNALLKARDAALAMTPFDQAGNQALADQVQNISRMIVSQANYVSEGRYLFGGYQVLSPPVVANPAGIPPYLYVGDDGESVVQLSRTIRLVTNVTAAQVLNLDGEDDPARDDVLETLRKLEAALRAGDKDALQAGLLDIEWHMARVLAVRAQTGARSQQIELAQQRLDDAVLTMRNLLSEVRDVDIAEALIGLRSQEVTYQAAAAAASALNRASLLDYF